MKKIALAIVVMMLALAGSASAGGIAAIRWNQSHIQTLRLLEKTDVLAFLNEQGAGRALTSTRARGTCF